MLMMAWSVSSFSTRHTSAKGKNTVSETKGVLNVLYKNAYNSVMTTSPAGYVP
jgi:hypothetical protein